MPGEPRSAGNKPAVPIGAKLAQGMAVESRQVCGVDYFGGRSGEPFAVAEQQQGPTTVAGGETRVMQDSDDGGIVRGAPGEHFHHRHLMR